MSLAHMQEPKPTITSFSEKARSFFTGKYVMSVAFFVSLLFALITGLVRDSIPVFWYIVAILSFLGSSSDTLKELFSKKK